MSTRRKYGGDDQRTPQQRREDSAHRVVALLAVMETDERPPDHPNAIATAAKYTHGLPLRTPHGHSGKRLGPGSAVSGTITSMERKGLVAWAGRRRDGLSGSAYRITAAGILHLNENRHLLDTPWHDNEESN